MIGSILISLSSIGFSILSAGFLILSAAFLATIFLVISFFPLTNSIFFRNNSPASLFLNSVLSFIISFSPYIIGLWQQLET